MGLKIGESNQLRAVEDSLKSSFYKNLNQAARKSTCMRFTGLFVGVASGASTVVTRITLIAENIFKGVVNIAGCPFFKPCSLRTGLSQIFWQIPKHLVLLPFSLLSAVVGIFTKTIFMLVDPQGYTDGRWCAHDPIEVANRREAAAEAKWQQQRNAYLIAAQIYEQNPQDIKNLKLLGVMHREGLGVKKDAEHACWFFSEAATLGDAEAMHIMGGFYFHGYHVQKDVNKAFQCFELAANRGFAPSMTLMGVRCLKIDDDRAFMWFELAAKKDEPQALVYGAKMIALGMGGNQPDLDKASEWFERAHRLGDKSAAHYLDKIEFFRGRILTQWTHIKDKSEKPEDVGQFFLDLYSVHQYHEKPHASYEKKMYDATTDSFQKIVDLCSIPPAPLSTL